MTWFRVDDRFAEHAKAEALEGDPVLWSRAIALWTMVGVYCSRNGTDGHIGIARLKRLTPLGAKAEAVADELVRVGLFEKTPAGYLMHDFLEWNPSAEDVEDERELNRLRQAAHRKRKRDAEIARLTDELRDKPSDGSRDVTGSVTQSVTRDVTVDVTRDVRRESQHPDPARPGPTRSVVIDPDRPQAILAGGDSAERTVTRAQLDAAFVDLNARPLGAKWSPRYGELEPFSPYELKCAWLAMARTCADGGSEPNPGLFLSKLDEGRRSPPAKAPLKAHRSRSGYQQPSETFEVGDVVLGR